MSDSKPRILVVEDDASMQDFLTTFLEQEGYEVRWAGHGGIARQLLQTEAFDVVITDIVMPEVDGLAVLDEVREEHPDTAVVVMTGHSSVRQAVDMIRRGADDYFKKPFDVEEMLHVIRRALDHRRALREERAALAPARPGVAPVAPEAFPRIIGESAAMEPVFDLILKVADTNSTVLIQGASGTGKELVAAAIQEKSSRRSGPFIPVHCGAIPETLLESELFGHEKGSFTGAIARKEGVFKLADGGTLFLDEISEIEASVQVKLLRVLEERTFERVGGDAPVEVDIRLVTATNRNLRQRVDEGNFREDLFFRLDVVDVNLPPLRQRAGDVPLLCGRFIEEFSARNNKAIAGITQDAVNLLATYAWPGNVRELRNTVEKMVVLAHGDRLTARDVPANIKNAARASGEHDEATAALTVSA